MSAIRILKIAAELISDDSENPEYDRGVVEMTCDILDIPMDAKESVGDILRAIRNRP